MNISILVGIGLFLVSACSLTLGMSAIACVLVSGTREKAFQEYIMKNDKNN